MGLMSPAEHQCGVALSCHVSHRNSHSQACSVVAARPLDIPQNSNGALWEGDSRVLGRDSLGKEADPAKEHGEFVMIFQNLTLFSIF